jgi:osmotically inducible lipoprotein OsmB
MNEATKKLAMALAIVTIAGCGTMSHRDRDTVVGAGVGAAAGAAITGDVGGAVGGGIVGGVIGNQVGRH